MLGKLLKYELKASGRMLLPIYGAVLVMGVISSLFLRTAPDMNWDNTIMTVLTMVSIILFFGLIFAALCLSLVVSILRFKKNLLGEEGYLMNTLPVSTWQNIAAKAIVAVLYQIISLIVAVFAGFSFTMVGANVSFVEIFGSVIDAFREILSQMGGVFWLYAVEILVIMLISTFGSNMMIYASMSVGHSMNSHKVVSSVAVFLGFYIVSQIINSLLLAGGAYFYALAGSYSLSELYRPQPAILAILVLEIAYLTAYFFITKYFLKRRLNLQ